MSKLLVALVCAVVLAGAGGAWAQGTVVSPGTGGNQAGSVDCSQAAVHWSAAESIGTREAYEDHLARFPNCAFATLAKLRLAALGQRAAPAASPPVAQGNCSQAEEDWNAAESAGTREAYQAHLAKFPSCSYATLAKVRIAALGQGGAPPASPQPLIQRADCSQVEEDWNAAEAMGTREAYQAHLAKFPNCSYSTLAKVRLAGLGQGTALPARAAAPRGDCSQAKSDWDSTEATGTREAYENHIARFPTCGFATLAQVRIAAIDQALGRLPH